MLSDYTSTCTSHQNMWFKYSRTCLKRPLKNRQNKGLKGKESQESILQYFRPSLSYQLSLRPLFCLSSSGCLRQVLLYISPSEFLLDVYHMFGVRQPFLLAIISNTWNLRPWSTVKPVLSSHSKEYQKLVFKVNYPLMQVKSIAESYQLSLRPFFSIFKCLSHVWSKTTIPSCHFF